MRISYYSEKRLINMKKSRFSESQILAILKAHDSGQSLSELCREHGVSAATFYRWKRKYEGVGSEELQRLRKLEQENEALKKMYAELSLDHELLKKLVGKKA